MPWIRKSGGSARGSHPKLGRRAVLPFPCSSSLRWDAPDAEQIQELRIVAEMCWLRLRKGILFMLKHPMCS